MIKRLSKGIATLGPIGYLPKAPGTWASMTGALIWYCAKEFIPNFHRYELVLVIIAAITGIITSGIVSKKGNKDPKEVVIDELAGMWIALLWLPHAINLTVAALILFRIFDIAKPFGIRSFEKLKGGWGIMLDDIAAGIVSALILHFTLFLI